MGKKKIILLAWTLLISLAMSYSCASNPSHASKESKKAEKTAKKNQSSGQDSVPDSIQDSVPDSIQDSVPDSIQEPKQSHPQNVSHAASDIEGREAVDQALQRGAGVTTQNSSSPPQSGSVQPASKGQNSSSVEGTPYPFPLDQEPESLQKLLLENSQMELETHKKCMAEISSLTVNAKNTDALRKLTESVVLMVKENINESHWCFLAIHHQLNRDINSSRMAIDQKMMYFQKTMLDLVALAKGLDQLTKGDRYISYNRERYITHFREQFGRLLGRVEGERR